ncbi:hypothetical protein TVAG_578760 [Trichomonas vaginalis G3]|uniref:Uncharacterized protein n=1 Tax=Trichomonas vaginalis (strain ATCC PRA-98 / G3) TaxID=412133 RepID=A2GUA1_TRIV3|nr:hypothetical protein TVAGG3_0731300 [Trichomonas vaginalis G3]EAX79266.1 hypothetical protein TVAG_578760 [Trichomonas vaginalis G3]KAI5511279.1 hypothetical protein TVAGG3_0731300 [Trichomonas vaginalis G3]|eukprot:XP_001292196.1 hypothetical protein [Trichomonas vaginalis G3]
MVNWLVKSFWHSESFLPTFQVLPSDIPSPSFRHSKFFHPTRKKFPNNWKKISRQLEKNFLLFVRKPFKFSKIENFLADLQKKFFLPTEKIFPDNWKKFSRQLEKFFLPTGHKRMSDVPPTDSPKARRTDRPSTTTD